MNRFKDEIIKGNRAIKEKVLSFKSDKSFVLFGNTGTGKTWTILHFIDKNNIDPVKYIRFVDFADMIHDYDSSYDITERLMKQDYLIIDDIGNVEMNNYLNRKLFRLIDYRYMFSLPLIATTNLAPDDLKEYIGDRIFRRLKEHCEFFILKPKEV